MNAIAQVLVDANGLEPLDEIWRQISNQSPKLDPVLKAAKRRVLETLLTSEFTVLSRLLARIASGHYSTRDYSADSLRQALELYVLHFPVYRTYLTSAGPTAHDRALIGETVERALVRRRRAFSPLRDALTMDLISRPSRARRRGCAAALKVRQFTGPMMAKSLEDTTFYQYHRLLALNGVGGDPAAKRFPSMSFTQRCRLGQTIAARHDRHRHPTPSAARTRAPGSWRWRKFRRIGQHSGAVEGAQRAKTHDRRRHACALGHLRIHAVPGTARRLAARTTKA
jgi:(1->4)-alpha-D-glucan 1-alpha-D-glucosylmutase